MTQNRDIGVRIGGGCVPARAIERQAAARVLTVYRRPLTRWVAVAVSYAGRRIPPAFAYDEVDFREVCVDVFHCGEKRDPQYRGMTRYYDTVPNRRIVSSGVVEVQGRKVLITMATVAFEPEGAGTKVSVTAQLTSLAGEQMLDGAKIGHNAALDNLVAAMW